jgi:hypothetical protein
MLATPSLHPICRTTNGSRWVSECLGSGRRGSAEARRACISGPSSALRARRWRSWLWAVPRQLRAGEERLGLCERWAQLLARRSPAGRCRRLPACSQKERCGSPVSRGGGRRNTVAGDSFYHRSRLKLPVVSKTLEEAKDHFDWSTQFVAGGVPASSRWTRERLAWQPRQPGLLPDIDQPDYFAGGVAPVV